MTETNESLKEPLFIDEEEEEEELPPAMPEKLPSLIKLLVSRTPTSTSQPWLMPYFHRLQPTSIRCALSMSTA